MRGPSLTNAREIESRSSKSERHHGEAEDAFNQYLIRFDEGPLEETASSGLMSWLNSKDKVGTEAGARPAEQYCGRIIDLSDMRDGESTN